MDISAICTEWLRDGLNADAETFERALSRCISAVERANNSLTFDEKPAVVILEPGNGWSYKIVVTLLPEPNAFGGNMLLSLPDWRVCILFDDHGHALHTPSYVAEKMPALDLQHVAVIAAFSTLLSAWRGTPVDPKAALAAVRDGLPT